MEKEETEEKAPKDVVQMRISKKVLWVSAVLVVLIALGLASWRLHFYQRAKNWYNRADISLKVKEGDTYALSGAVINLVGANYTTDTNGKVTVPRIVAGHYVAHITKDGYTPVDKDLAIKRGDNDLVIIAMTKVPEKTYTISGYVQDSVSGLPVFETEVSLNGTVKTTNPNGEFSFDTLQPGDYKLILSKSGYLDKEMPITLTTNNVTGTKVTLVPAGQVIFTSNRDGKRALYSSAYDGGNQHQFVVPQNSGEDFNPLISPDNKWVLFLSTRDQVKNSYGTIVSRLYLATNDGQNVKKLNDDLDQHSIQWSPNGRYVFFQGYTSTDESQVTARFYDVTKGTTFDLGDTTASPVVFTGDSTVVAYTVAKYGENNTTGYTNYLNTLNLATGERKNLIKKTGNSFTNLSISSDSKTLYYQMADANGEIRFAVNIGSGTEQAVPLPTTSNRTYVVSPDASQQAFIETRDGKTDLFVVDMQGANEKRLTNLGVVSNQVAPTWDDTGRYITFAVHREGENALYVVALAGGDPKKVADFYDATASGQ